ncbi:TetR/AcrR family transcriptional regulator [Nocardioides alkalitolerans]|uniref:TetR/AcrR family transcriptional regulator n=1 Tax=Nocardioides alkalitolerans TaxID=281714 RepID=UPI0003FD06D0|nr:TetR/AcrR family transcriptional regulator [Nocardioides alkalitolerans]
MSPEGARTRRTRSDSVRNRSEILDVAERHFADRGVSASLEAVARDAGVGSATLYRHFPTRDALLVELLDRRTAQVVSDIERLEQMADSGEALAGWMVALEEFFGVFDGLPGPLRDAFLEEHNPLASTCIGFIERTDHFLGAAQRDGKARADVSGRDLFLAALALSWARGSSLAGPDSPARLRALLRDGFAGPDAG